MRYLLACLLPLVLLVMTMAPVTAADGDERCWELRTYVTPPGKLPALLDRFRNHTCKLFEKHGMTLIGFWTPTDGEAANNTLIYVLSHKDRAAATESWKNFRADPVWVEAKKASEVDGSLTTSVTSVFMKPTDFSKLK